MRWAAREAAILGLASRSLGNQGLRAASCSEFAVLVLALQSFARTNATGSRAGLSRAETRSRCKTTTSSPAPLHQRALLEHDVAEPQAAAHLEEARAHREARQVVRRACPVRARSGRPTDFNGARCRAWTMRSAVARSSPAIAAASTSRDAVLTLTERLLGQDRRDRARGCAAIRDRCRTRRAGRRMRGTSGGSAGAGSAAAAAPLAPAAGGEAARHCAARWRSASPRLPRRRASRRAVAARPSRAGRCGRR